MDKPLTSEEFGQIYSKVPRLTVEVVVKTEKGVVLSLRSIDPYLGWWHIPGGTVYVNETLEEAVKRVALEEIGVKVEIEKFCGYIEYKDNEKVGTYGKTVGLAYIVRIVGGKLSGSVQGEVIGEFKKSPEKFILDQKEFLEREGII